MQAKSLSKMSALELQDRHIPGMCILASLSGEVSWLTSLGRELHSGHDGMDGIEELGHVGGVYCARSVFLLAQVMAISVITIRTIAVPPLHTRLLQRTKSFGSPTLLFLTGAALRVANVTRVLKNKTLQGEKGAGVAKLFAKHVKLEEHVDYLKKTKIGSAVGTPARVGKLLCDTGECVSHGKNFQPIEGVSTQMRCPCLP